MLDNPNQPSRRAFIGDALKLGVGTVLLSSIGKAEDASSEKRPIARPDRASAELASRLRDRPSAVFIDHDGTGPGSTNSVNGVFSSARAAVTLVPTGTGHDVRVSCPVGPLTRVVLRWELTLPAGCIFLGDHWERGYGDLQWRFLQPERIMPWYFAAHDPATGDTFMAGVKTQPAALCFWTADAAGVSLWLDFRNGGNPSIPGDREIAAATIVAVDAKAPVSPFAALTQLCRQLCLAPRLSRTPICGNNNWYYAYGRNFDAVTMGRDAGFLAEMASGHANRPYCVIDAGWTPTPDSVCPGGPWTEGHPTRFPDMPGLSADMKRLGVLPGIWMRPTALMTVDDPRRLRPGRGPSVEKPLDLTRQENLRLIHDDVARVRGWGYDLIKHDFSTFDIFGKWGFEMGAELTEPGWHHADQSLTNAEIVLGLYRTLRDAAGDAILLGCNTIGHLGAGLFEVQRSGDDTSGKAWERTRRMGVNTLAYRLPQNRTFFSVDADCAAHTDDTPWELDRQFLDLVARSGTSLFISVDPRKATPDQKTAYRNAMQLALSGGDPGGFEPLDWLHSTAPREWRSGNSSLAYKWEQPFGTNPMRV